ncbi:hypothetical protein BHM03_00044187 [Ensete ventricosum]|nr:hypothetical protein BHM03_00044187 [Ensete ventricosum]
MRPESCSWDVASPSHPLAVFLLPLPSRRGRWSPATGRRIQIAVDASAEDKSSASACFFDLNRRRMGTWEAVRRGRLLIALLVAAAAIPLASSAAAITLPNKAKASSPPQLLSELPVHAGRLVPSSVVFPIYGDVYPHGLYYVAMNIGDPSKPYFLDVDTGSDLTWLQCDAPCVSCSKVRSYPHPLPFQSKFQHNSKLVPSGDPLCAALHSGIAQDENSGQCDYEIQYEDRESSLGVLIYDAFSLRLTNSTRAGPILAFGSASDLQHFSYNSIFPTDIQCSWYAQVWVRSAVRGPGRLCADRRCSRAWHREVVLEFVQSRGLDVSELETLQVRSDLSNTPLKEEFDDSALPVCWKGQKPFKSVSDVKKYFKTLALDFRLIRKSYSLLLLLIELWLDCWVFSDISLQDHMVVYDNEKQHIGWVRAACNRLPKSGTSSL